MMDDLYRSRTAFPSGHIIPNMGMLETTIPVRCATHGVIVDLEPR